MLPRLTRLLGTPLSLIGQSPATSLRFAASANSCAFTPDHPRRSIEETEDAYWQAQFSRETYYAAGRGYDQYRPAYELGWSAAMEFPNAQFNEVVRHLERQWDSRRATSLLPWREVEDAVKRAWFHADKQMQLVQNLRNEELAQNTRSSLLLIPLCRACMLLVEDLQRWSEITMDDFAQQVLARHVRLLNRMALQLQSYVRREADENSLPPLPQRLALQWHRLKVRWEEWDARQVFEDLEKRERDLLNAYQSCLQRALPGSIRQVLKQHVKLLQSDVGKLSWIRQNWMV